MKFDLIKKSSERWSVPCFSDNGEVTLENFDESINVNDTDCYGEEETEEENEDFFQEIEEWFIAKWGLYES